MYTFTALTLAAWCLLLPQEPPVEVRLVKSKLVNPPVGLRPSNVPSHEIVEYEVRNVSDEAHYVMGLSLQRSSAPERVISSSYRMAPLMELAPGETKRSTMRVYLNPWDADWRKTPTSIRYQWWPTEQTWEYRIKTEFNKLRSKLPGSAQAGVPEFPFVHKAQVQHVTTPPVTEVEPPFIFRCPRRPWSEGAMISLPEIYVGPLLNVVRTPEIVPGAHLHLPAFPLGFGKF